MKLSYKKNLIFIGIAFLFSYFLTSCMKEDNHIDWKVINEQWYESHKNEAGFTLLPSGVSYKIFADGNSADGRPNDASYIKATYKGSFLNDSVFDSRVDYDFFNSNAPLRKMTVGFREVLLKMHPGDSCVMYIPWEQGYGKEGSGSIPPYSTLKFNVRLKSFYNYQF